jgi:hypothetical protein
VHDLLRGRERRRSRKEPLWRSSRHAA